MKTRLYNILFKSLDASVVSVFRIIFGVFMVYQMYYYFQIDYTFQFMSGPKILFHYSGFEFLKPFSLSILKGIHIGLIFSAILITLGFLYRYAMIFFFLGFSYFTFIDKTLYNNHLYLMALIAFVMIFINADKKYSLRSKFSKKLISDKIPAWNQYILIFIISLPYFFGGIAKLSSNWLHTNLVDIIVKESQGSFLHGVFSDGILVNLVKYGGIIYDLSIVFLLLNRRTRKLAFVLVVIFNYSNNTVLFKDIGIFPFFMICASVLFFDASKVGNFLDAIFVKKSTAKKFKNKQERIEFKEQQELSKIKNSSQNWTLIRKITAICIVFFVVFQLLFPFRHVFLTNNPEWTGIASRFSWRMKMQTRKIIDFKMSLTDRKSGTIFDLDGKSYVSTNQFIHMKEDPFTFVQLSKYISKIVEQEKGLVNPIIKADIKVKFNGLPGQSMISPDVDLTKIDVSYFGDNSWIPPLKIPD